MSNLKFLQFSDLHLGARILPRCFSVTSEIRKKREQEVLKSLEKLISISKSEDIEVVFAVGDIFDRDTVSSDVVNIFFDIMAELPPVYLVPGNHDYISGASPYSIYEREKRGLTEIPENVCIFTGNDYSTFYHPDRADVSIYGRPFTSNVRMTEHSLVERIPRDPTPITILLHHGARTQFAFEEAAKITAPFTSHELLAQGFSYTALGHYHSFSVVKNAQGMIKAAYSGRPFACELTSRQGCCLGGTITPEGVEELIHYDIDERKIHNVIVHCDNVESNQQLKNLAELEITKQGVTAADIVRFVFRGSKISNFNEELLFSSNDFFAVTADFSHLVLGYDIEELLKASEGNAASAESLFVKKIYKLLVEAESEKEKQILYAALDYGMKALRGIKIVPREVDLGE